MEKYTAYTGALDMATVDAFVGSVRREARECDRYVIDCGGLSFIDSTGVRSLVLLKNELKAQGKRLVLKNLSREIVEILDILGIRTLLLEE